METKKLEDIVYYQEGPGVRKWQFRDSGIKLLNVGNIVEGQLQLSKTERHLDKKEVEEKYKHFLLEENDIVMASSGVTWGKTAFVKQIHLPLCLNTSTIRFRTKNENILTRDYLYWFLNSPSFTKQIDRLVTGSAQPNFGPYHLRQVSISVPSVAEQKIIAEILVQADKARQQRKAANALTDEFLQSSFLSLFGDPVKNEKGWEVKKFSEIGNLDRGKSKHRPRNAPELLGGPFPLIQTGDVANCTGYIYCYTQTYSEIGLKQSKMWPIGTLCITIAANIAKTGILTFEACFPDSVVGFTPNNNSCTEYVQYWLSFLQETLEANAPESAQKNINLEILRNLDIPVPPISLQQQFAAIVAEAEALRKKQQESEQELEQLFQSLLQKYFG